VREGASDEQARSDATYEADGTVEFYRTFRDDLFPGEEHLFDTLVWPGQRVLDLGIGTGRTSRPLADRVRPPGDERAATGRYVGLDYSAKMVAAARSAAPDLDLIEGDAADLGAFADGSFDVVVFSFNGIDCLHPDRVRHACLAEIARVLVADGTFIVSAHDPAAVVVRPRRWRGEPIDRKAKQLVLAGRSTVVRLAQVARSGRLLASECYFDDVTNDGAPTHAARPATFATEVGRYGFERFGPLIGAEHPRSYRRFVTPWYYVTFRRLPV
jgi:ubiquinone/menaquinone biosynthesis C-methylase UbiE